MYLIAGLAAVTTILLVGLIFSRAGSFDEGYDTLRLIANVLALGLLAAILGAVAVLAWVGWRTRQYGYWLGALAVFGIGMKFYGDVTQSRTDPIAEWFGGRSYSRTADLIRDTVRLWRKRSRDR